MTVLLAITVAVTFGVSVFLMLGRELKGIAIGVFVIGHAANLCILAQSGSPVVHGEDGNSLKRPPILGQGEDPSQPLATIVDPLPQALILTAIVISFGVMAFLLTMIVKTSRETGSLDIEELAEKAQEA